MRVYNKKIASAQVLNADWQSQAQQLQQMSGYAIQVEINGTPTGAFKLQSSNDPYLNMLPADQQPTNWTDIANSSFSVSASGSVFWNVSSVYYNWVRVVFTDGSSGTSTATATGTLNAKGMAGSL